MNSRMPSWHRTSETWIPCRFTSSKAQPSTRTALMTSASLHSAAWRRARSTRILAKIPMPLAMLSSTISMPRAATMAWRSEHLRGLLRHPCERARPAQRQRRTPQRPDACRCKACPDHFRPRPQEVARPGHDDRRPREPPLVYEQQPHDGLRKRPILRIHHPRRRHGERDDRIHKNKRPRPSRPIHARASQSERERSAELAAVKEQ